MLDIIIETAFLLAIIIIIIIIKTKQQTLNDDPTTNPNYKNKINTHITSKETFPMQLLAFSVYDSKAESFLPPFFLHNIALAIRSFTQACNDPTHAFARFPEDYTLFHVGSFQSAAEPNQPPAGTLTQLATPLSLGLATQHIQTAFPRTESTDPSDSVAQSTPRELSTIRSK